MRILHLSDLHLPRGLGADDHGLDARAILTQLLDDCRHLTDLDLVVVSGDITDDGSTEGYRDALALVQQFARKHGAAHVWCTGNHDDRENFVSVLGSGHHDAIGNDVGHAIASDTTLRAATSVVRGLRIITLDSLLPGAVHGEVTAEQLAWLRDVLATPAPAGSIVVLHHPPISVSPQWAVASLSNPSELADVLQGSDVQAVLCGHVHAQVAGALAGVPVWVGPGVITRIDLTTPADIVRAVRGAGATVIDIAPGVAPVFSVVQARDHRAGEQVYLADITTWQYLDDDSESRRRDEYDAGHDERHQ